MLLYTASKSRHGWAESCNYTQFLSTDSSSVRGTVALPSRQRVDDTIQRWIAYRSTDQALNRNWVGDRGTQALIVMDCLMTLGRLAHAVCLPQRGMEFATEKILIIGMVVV